MSKQQKHDKSRHKNQSRQTRGQDSNRGKSPSKDSANSKDSVNSHEEMSVDTIDPQDPKTSALPRVIEHSKLESGKGLIPMQSLVAPRKQIQVKQIHARNAKNTKRNYKVVFFDTVHTARAEVSRIEELKQSCDQLNIVIRAETQVETQDLDQLGTVYKGAAWALIHDRRVQDGWYEFPQE